MFLKGANKCQEKETTIHVVQCQDEKSLATYRESRTTLKKWLQKTTSLAIMKAVLLHMDAYQSKSNVEHTNELPDKIRLAAIYQESIGIRSFGEGLLSPQWRKVQRDHCKEQGGHKTSRYWVLQLIQHPTFSRNQSSHSR